MTHIEGPDHLSHYISSGASAADLIGEAQVASVARASLQE